MSRFGSAVASLLLFWTGLVYVPFRWRPIGRYLFVAKLYAAASTPFVAAAGLLLAAVGALRKSWPMVLPAALAASGATTVVARLGRLRPNLAAALGPGWEARIPADRRARMVSPRWRGRLPTAPEPRAERDVPFATVPATGRSLLCDVWRPPAGVAPSGLGIVYLHGSAFYIFDKDFATRPLFRHLASQGHVIMDVAYRLFPEAGVAGMVGDAKRAVAWLADHAAEFDVERQRIALVGGSAGGHLALLAAFARDDALLTPAELAGSDPQVCGVASLYGTVDLAAVYDHTGQRTSCRPDDPQPDWNAPPAKWMTRLFGPDAARLGLQRLSVTGRMDWLIGGTPEQVPDRYERVSAIRHVHGACPPTLLVHGEHDEMAPVGSVRELEHELQRADVPVTALFLPHTDHAFDIVGTAWSPPARTAIHVLERFLAGLASADRQEAG